MCCPILLPDLITIGQQRVFCPPGSTRRLGGCRARQSFRPALRLSPRRRTGKPLHLLRHHVRYRRRRKLVSRRLPRATSAGRAVFVPLAGLLGRSLCGAGGGNAGSYLYGPLLHGRRLGAVQPRPTCPSPATSCCGSITPCSGASPLHGPGIRSQRQRHRLRPARRQPGRPGGGPTTPCGCGPGPACALLEYAAAGTCGFAAPRATDARTSRPGYGVALEQDGKRFSPAAPGRATDALPQPGAAPHLVQWQAERQQSPAYFPAPSWSARPASPRGCSTRSDSPAPPTRVILLWPEPQSLYRQAPRRHAWWWPAGALDRLSLNQPWGSNRSR